MRYELRIADRVDARFEDAEAAERHACALLRQNADLEIAIIDLETGRAYAPGADAADRDDLARKVGF